MQNLRRQLSSSTRGVHRRSFPACATGVLALLIAVVFISGCGGGNARMGDSSATRGRPRLTLVPWPALRRLWVAQVETSGKETWVRTLVPTAAGNLFAVNSTTLGVRSVPVGGRLEGIFAGDGQLWALPDEGRSVQLIEPATGKAESHPTHAACGQLARPDGVVRLGKLWLACNGKIATYTPNRNGADTVQAPRSFHLVASKAGVWAVTSQALVGIGGDATGRKIPLRRLGEPHDWQGQGKKAWALDRAANDEVLDSVDLNSGVVRRFRLNTGGKKIESFAIAPNSIWVVPEGKPLILQFSHASPKRSVARIDLEHAAGTGEAQLFLTAGPSHLWAALFSHRQYQLFRITESR
jgi:hypothetical protein